MIFGPFTGHITRYKRRIFLALGIILVAQIGTASIPLILDRIVSAISSGVEAGGGAARPSYDTYVLWLVGIAGAVFACRALIQWLVGSVSNRIEYDIRTSYFTHILSLPVSYVQGQNTGDLITRLTNDLRSIQTFFRMGIRRFSETALMFSFCIFLMFAIEWHLALAALMPMLVLGGLSVYLAASVKKHHRSMRDQLGHINNFVSESIDGIRTIRAYALEQSQLIEFAGRNQAYLDTNIRLVRIRALYSPLSALIGSVSLGLIMWMGGHSIIDGRFTLGSFVAFSAYINLLVQPFAPLVDNLQRALVAMERINGVMGRRPEDVGAHGGRAAADMRGHIRFCGVSFSYNGSPVLQDIDLDVPAASTLGIVGRVGSGKSTLVELIPKLIQADKGQLTIDGVPVEDWPLQRLRAGIAFAPQQAFLFSGTVKDNIAYGAEGLKENALAGLVEQAQLGRDISKFHDGLDTVVGERGITLSGGQRQRCSLARALAAEPGVLVIDDALSAVDEHTEKAILAHLMDGQSRHTTIIVTHRIAALQKADHIVVLDKGRIVDRGTHEQLASRGGLYTELLAHQQAGGAAN